MLQKKVLESLNIGDTLEAGKLFPGMSPEPIVWQLIEIQNQSVWTFMLSWCGIPIGRAKATLNKGLVKMSQVKT